MVNNEFRTLIDSLRIAMSGEDSSSIEASVRVVLDKYTGKWEKTVLDSEFETALLPRA